MLRRANTAARSAGTDNECSEKSRLYTCEAPFRGKRGPPAPHTNGIGRVDLLIQALTGMAFLAVSDEQRIIQVSSQETATPRSGSVRPALKYAAPRLGQSSFQVSDD